MGNRECSKFSQQEETYEERQRRVKLENMELKAAAKILSEEFGFKMEEKDWDDVRNGNGLVYGFDMKIDTVRKLRRHCMSDNFPDFLEHHIVPLMASWCKKHEKASKEEHDQALKALLETASYDYKYGRVDREMPEEVRRKKAEEAVFDGEMSDEEYYSGYIETREEMVNQLKIIIEQVREKVFQEVEEKKKSSIAA